MPARKPQLLMTVVLKQLDQFALQSLPSSQESGCTLPCITKLNFDKPGIHKTFILSESIQTPNDAWATERRGRARVCGTEHRFGSSASWGGPWERKVQGK